MLTEPFPKPLGAQFLIMFHKVLVFCLYEASKTPGVQTASGI